MVPGLLPVRTRPKPEESLSSWIARTAFENGIYLQTFCHLVWHRKPIWNRDTDRTEDLEILRRLASLTATSPQKAIATTIRHYEGLVFRKFSVSGTQRHVTSLGIYHRTHKRFGQTYCPLCLEEEGYFKLSWRFAFITVCTKHNQRLWDRCWKCETPICIHRGRWLHCDACDADLRKASSLERDSRALLLQTHLQAAMEGRPFWAVPAQSSLNLFDLIYDFSRALGTRHPKNQAFRTAICELAEARPNWVLPIQSSRYPQTETMECLNRHQIMAFIARIFSNWPWTFVACATRADFRASCMFRDWKPTSKELAETVEAFLSYPSANLPDNFKH
jgi:hypothetical protein